jgi:hypothetical protein
MTTESTMNVPRGFFRIWVILSVLWIVAVISTYDKIMTRM